jgi:hypothetical protein
VCVSLPASVYVSNEPTKSVYPSKEQAHCPHTRACGQALSYVKVVKMAACPLLCKAGGSLPSPSLSLSVSPPLPPPLIHIHIHIHHFLVELHGATKFAQTLCMCVCVCVCACVRT